MPETRRTELDLPLLVRRATARHAASVAVEDVAGRRLTFAEVESRSNRIGHALAGWHVPETGSASCCRTGSSTSRSTSP